MTFLPSMQAALTLAMVIALSGGAAQAQEVYPSRILSVLLRNLPDAEFSADAEFLAFLREAGGMKPDLADIVALGMSPTTAGPLGPTLPVSVLVDGECETGTGTNPECRLRFMQSGGEGDEKEMESALVLIFRLDRPVDEDGARIVGQVQVEVAG